MDEPFYRTKYKYDDCNIPIFKMQRYNNYNTSIRILKYFVSAVESAYQDNRNWILLGKIAPIFVE